MLRCDPSASPNAGTYYYLACTTLVKYFAFFTSFLFCFVLLLQRTHVFSNKERKPDRERKKKKDIGKNTTKEKKNDEKKGGEKKIDGIWKKTEKEKKKALNKPKREKKKGL